jgi:hypothetical protein
MGVFGMRASVRESDPGYSKDANQCTVYLDGEDVSKICFTADEELGCVWVYQTGPDGMHLLNEFETEVLTECLHGKVEIVKKISA